MADHPVEAHEYLLRDMRERLDHLEAQVQDLMQWKAGSVERLNSISDNIATLKDLMERYTTKVEASLERFEKDIADRFTTIEKDIQELKGRPGRKWDDFVRTVTTVLVGLVVGYVFSKLQGG